MDFLCPHVDKADVENLFVTNDVDAFKRGIVGKRVTETFAKAGMRKEICVSSTRIKFASSIPLK